MEKLKQKVRQTIKEHHMLQPGDPVIIALSGGGRLCLPFKSACRYERGIWIKD